MRTPEEYQALLKKNNLPQLEGEVIDCRYVASQDDWWARTARGWFWFDRRTSQWKRAPLGPPY